MEIMGGAIVTASRAGPRFAATLDPAALSRDQHGLGSVHRAERAVHVVQMGPHGAGREAELAGDLLVDHAACKPTEYVDLAGRHGARIDLPGAAAGSGQREVVHDRSQVSRS